MTTYVMVHGSWGGGWIWSRLATQLRQRGHHVLAPSLTGLGDRAHLLSDQVTLETHIEDIAALLRLERLRDVVLVGHSYGGMVVTGAVAREPRAVARIAYIDAFVPEPGQSCVDILPWAREPFEALASPHAGLYMDPMDPEQLGVTSPQDAAWIRERSSLMPIAAVLDPLPDTAIPGAVASASTTFISCRRPGLFPDAASMARNRGWSLVELDSDHFPFVTHVDEVAEILQYGLA